MGFGHLLGEVAQRIELGSNGLGSGQLSVSVAFLGDQLPTDLGGAEARVEAVGAELGVGLALAFNNGSDIGEQGGEMVFGALATPRGEVVLNGDATLEFVGAFANDGA